MNTKPNVIPPWPPHMPGPWDFGVIERRLLQSLFVGAVALTLSLICLFHFLP